MQEQRRAGEVEGAMQHGNYTAHLEQSTISQYPLLTSLLYTLAFFLYTPSHHPHVHKRSMNARSSVGDSETKKKKKKKLRNHNKGTSHSGGPKVPLLERAVDGWVAGGQVLAPILRKKRSSHGGWMKSGG